MRILIVEDEPSKFEQLSNVVHSVLAGDIDIISCESLLSAILNIDQNHIYDLAVLDMSMPNYDISDEEPTGGDSESFAGRELMYQMKFREKLCPIIVVTQYQSFEKGLRELNDLDVEFKDEFSGYYMGCVYYNAAVDGWVDKFKDFLITFKNDKNENSNC
ncbi:hypothetical protein [Pantoea agglomerans]|uniref:hypothetical protein n=1 Tax=Enterobacter agglomerans TaxID=549 RepID=UPI003C7A4524